MRREDPRRHTLGGDVLAYANQQNQQHHQQHQQHAQHQHMPHKTMDLEVRRTLRNSCTGSRLIYIAFSYIFDLDEYTSTKKQKGLLKLFDL